MIALAGRDGYLFDEKGNKGLETMTLLSSAMLRAAETVTNEAPNRSRAAGYLMTPCSTEVAVGMPCPSRSRAAGYND